MMRPNAKVSKAIPLPQARRLPKIHRRAGRSGRTRHQGRCVRPSAVRVPQPGAQPGEDPVLGAQRLLPVAQAPGSRALQGSSGAGRRGHRDERPGAEPPAGRLRPVAQPFEQTVDAATPQMALFNEAESLAEPLTDAVDAGTV